VFSWERIFLRDGKPIDNIPDELYLEDLYDDYEGFRLLLKWTDIQL